MKSIMMKSVMSKISSGIISHPFSAAVLPCGKLWIEKS